MKATVIKSFKCKLTKKLYAPGKPYEADPERIAFLQEAGYLDGTPLPVPPVELEPVDQAEVQPEPEPDITLAEPAPAEKEKEQGAPAAADNNAYQLMTKKELFKELSKRGIKFNERQNKTELINLLQKETRGEKA